MSYIAAHPSHPREIWLKHITMLMLHVVNTWSTSIQFVLSFPFCAASAQEVNKILSDFVDSPPMRHSHPCMTIPFNGVACPGSHFAEAALRVLDFILLGIVHFSIFNAAPPRHAWLRVNFTCALCARFYQTHVVEQNTFQDVLENMHPGQFEDQALQNMKN